MSFKLSKNIVYHLRDPECPGAKCFFLQNGLQKLLPQQYQIKIIIPSPTKLRRDIPTPLLHGVLFKNVVCTLTLLEWHYKSITKQTYQKQSDYTQVKLQFKKQLYTY
jgi:hypothetical protein